MEQSRSTSPSPRVLEGLAKALRLNSFERAHLFRLARPDLQSEPRADVSRSLKEPFGSILQGLAPHPAYAINARWDVVAWNEPAARLLGGFGPPGDPRRNVLVRLFVDPEWRRLFVNWETIARSAVQQFRGTAAGLFGKPEFDRFIGALEKASPDFAACWEHPLVQGPPACRKVLMHPGVGRMSFDYATFRPDSADQDVRFTIYTPADEETACRLRALPSEGGAGARATDVAAE